MKNLATLFIEVYQTFISLFLKNITGISSSCRFSPTCSEYAKQAVENYGVLKGSYKTFARIIRCNPLGGFGFDKLRS